MAKPFEEGNSPGSQDTRETLSSSGQARTPPPSPLTPPTPPRPQTHPNGGVSLGCAVRSCTNNLPTGQWELVEAGADDGGEDRASRLMGMKLREIGDHLHTSHMQRALRWERIWWLDWYWAVFNVFLQTVRILPRRQ